MQREALNRRGQAPALWVLAGVLAALIGLHLLRPAPVNAAVVSRIGGLTVLTASAGNEDVLVILDERNEALFTYRTDARQGVQLMQRIPLGELFAEARARSLGGP